MLQILEIMVYKLSDLPLLKDGQKWGKIVQSDKGEFLARTIETVQSLRDGKPMMKAIVQPNTVFMAETGEYFIRTLDDQEADVPNELRKLVLPTLSTVSTAVADVRLLKMASYFHYRSS